MILCVNIKKYTTEFSVYIPFPFCISCGKICARDLWAYFQMGINIYRVLENMLPQSLNKTLHSDIRDAYSFALLFIQQAHTVHH